MGQKVNPHGLRVGVIKDWDSRWFANKSDFGDTLVEDYNVRKFIKKNLYAAGVRRSRSSVSQIRLESTSTAQSRALLSAVAAQRLKNCVRSWKKC